MCSVADFSQPQVSSVDMNNEKVSLCMSSTLRSHRMLMQIIDPPLMAWAAVGIIFGGYLHYVFRWQPLGLKLSWSFPDPRLSTMQTICISASTGLYTSSLVVVSTCSVISQICNYLGINCLTIPVHEPEVKRE